jgi:NTE family protein
MPPEPIERALPNANEARHALGIVLSGGGSRGIAHIGVLRALVEQGIHPTCIAGVSAGAIVGALYAAGYSPAKMLDFFTRTEPFRLANVAIAKPGIWDTAKFVPAFRRYFPDDSFEALPKRLVILATDLLRGEGRVFDRGPLILPMLASSSVPMVFSPTEIDGCWYGDGGIVDNFPVRLIADRCDLIIGVHVNPLREVTPAELGNSLAVIERALEIGMFTKAREDFSRCEVVIRPPNMARFGMFETKRIEEIEAAGYQAAKARMPELERLVKVAGALASAAPPPHWIESERPPAPAADPA